MMELMASVREILGGPSSLVYPMLASAPPPPQTPLLSARTRPLSCLLLMRSQDAYVLRKDLSFLLVKENTLQLSGTEYLQLDNF